MKKFITLLVAILISTTTFAQKNELKAASKALDASNFAQTIQVLKSVESTIGSAKEKYKTQYYFLLGKALYANGTTPNSLSDAVEAFNKLIKLEESGTKKYSADATAIVNSIVEKVADKAGKSYDEAVTLSKNEEMKDDSKPLFIDAAEGFKKVYVLSKRDTAYLQNSALAYFLAEDYSASIDNYKKLKEVGYTGATTLYTATSAVSNQRVSYATKDEMEKQVKLKLASDPKVEVRESQRNNIIQMIAKNYIALNDNENALAAIKEAQAATPDDYGLLVDEANVYFAMGDNLKFKEKLEEAVEINPTDPMLYYNIGVMKMELDDKEGAIESFISATQLKPDYTDAYNNLGAVILTKAKPIVEEMNKNLNDFKKYDQLQAKQLEVYKEALPYYEKAFELDTTRISIVQTLMGIYENLEMSEKAKELREVYNNLKE